MRKTAKQILPAASLAGVCTLAGLAGAHAEVVTVSAAGLEVREVIHVAASADKAYAVLITPAKWWSSEHTFSHDAANLTLDAHAGGCWCERLPGGGSVEHLHVLYVAPGKVLRLRGALGPFQAYALDGVMTVTVKPTDGGADLEMSYSLGGFAKDGFEMSAKVVDMVLTEQVQRLKKAIDG
jgi:Polyketide cyclase / dehydrase and lipid transport